MALTPPNVFDMLMSKIPSKSTCKKLTFDLKMFDSMINYSSSALQFWSFTLKEKHTKHLTGICFEALVIISCSQCADFQN